MPYFYRILSNHAKQEAVIGQLPIKHNYDRNDHGYDKAIKLWSLDIVFNKSVSMSKNQLFEVWNMY